MIIKDTCAAHGATINSLAEQGHIEPVRFTVDGVAHVANSMWAATDFLKREGHYARKAAITYQLEADAHAA